MSGMSFNEYQKLAQRTANTDNHIAKVHNGVLGLAGESGECVDILKKYLFQEHPLDTASLIDELSDVLWYCAELAEGIGISLEDVAKHNIEKLKKRFPEGFDSNRSMNRDE